MTRPIPPILACFAVVIMISLPAEASTELLGPIPYRSFDDSPFNGLGLASFQLEDFEDHVMDVPGATIGPGLVGTETGWYQNAPWGLDSVDGDDGNPNDGTCSNCDSWFSSPGLGMPVRVEFSPGGHGKLPTHAGIVWTDGEDLTVFEAFGADGESLGVIGPVDITDGSLAGTTGDDHFFGVIHTGGISAIQIEVLSRGIELDHVQYGYSCASDTDGDGFGDPGDPACSGGGATDCDDSDPSIFPGAVEICDGVDNDCDGEIDEVWLIPEAAITLSPSTVNVNSQGTGFSVSLELLNVCDPLNPQPIDEMMLGGTYISRAGEISLPDPATILCPDPLLGYLFERGVVDNIAARSQTGQGINLRFNMSPDGDCRTLDGDRQDLIALLADVQDNSLALVCLAGEVLGEIFEACTEITVRNRGNR